MKTTITLAAVMLLSVSANAVTANTKQQLHPVLSDHLPILSDNVEEPSLRDESIKEEKESVRTIGFLSQQHRRALRQHEFNARDLLLMHR